MPARRRPAITIMCAASAPTPTAHHHDHGTATIITIARPSADRAAPLKCRSRCRALRHLRHGRLERGEPAADRPRQHLDLRRARDGADRARLENPPTRHAARKTCSPMARRRCDGARRAVLARLRFSVRLSRRFRRAARLGGAAVARRLGRDRATGSSRTSDNGNNRFAVAAELNRRVSARRVSVLGLPAASCRRLPRPEHHRRHGGDGLAEKRLVDAAIAERAALLEALGTGSVGSQALTGIPIVRALRDDPRWATARASGRSRPASPRPSDATGRSSSPRSIRRWCAERRARSAKPKDAAQVRSGRAPSSPALDRAGDLAALFAGDRRPDRRAAPPRRDRGRLDPRRDRSAQCRTADDESHRPSPYPSPRCGRGDARRDLRLAPAGRGRDPSRSDGGR